MNISVSGDVIRRYRTNRHLTLEKVSERTKIPRSQLEKYEREAAEIDSGELEKLAAVFKISWLAFLDDTPEVTPDFGHDNRSMSNQHEKLDVDTIEVLEDTSYLLDIANELLPDVGFSLEGYKANTNNPEQSAAALRDFLKVKVKSVRELDDDYAVLRYWKDIFSSQGLYIFERSWSVKSIRAFSLVRGDKAAVVLSTKDRPLARVFSLLHEVYHIINNQPGLCDFHIGQNQDIEVLCNRFAAAFLMPQIEFVPYAEAMGLSVQEKNSVTENDVQMLRSFFKASRLSVYRRLLTCGFISKTFYEKIQDGYEDAPPPNRPKGGGDFYKNRVNAVGKRFTIDMLGAYANNQISVKTLARLMNIRVTQLSRITNLVGGNEKTS